MSLYFELQSNITLVRFPEHIASGMTANASKSPKCTQFANGIILHSQQIHLLSIFSSISHAINHLKCIYYLHFEECETYKRISKNWEKRFPKIYNTITNMKFVYNRTGVKRYFVYDVINGE